MATYTVGQYKFTSTSIGDYDKQDLLNICASLKLTCRKSWVKSKIQEMILYHLQPSSPQQPKKPPSKTKKKTTDGDDEEDIHLSQDYHLVIGKRRYPLKDCDAFAKLSLSKSQLVKACQVLGVSSKGTKKQICEALSKTLRQKSANAPPPPSSPPKESLLQILNPQQKRVRFKNKIYVMNDCKTIRIAKPLLIEMATILGISTKGTKEALCQSIGNRLSLSQQQEPPTKPKTPPPPTKPKSKPSLPAPAPLLTQKPSGQKSMSIDEIRQAIRECLQL